jgi:hypothetical protein
LSQGQDDALHDDVHFVVRILDPFNEVSLIVSQLRSLFQLYEKLAQPDAEEVPSGGVVFGRPSPVKVPFDAPAERFLRVIKYDPAKHAKG